MAESSTAQFKKVRKSPRKAVDYDDLWMICIVTAKIYSHGASTEIFGYSQWK